MAATDLCFPSRNRSLLHSLKTWAPVDPAGAKDRQFQFQAQIVHGIDQSKLAKLLGGWAKASFGVCEILRVEVNSEEKVLIWAD